jgi:hypothetical protein
MQEHASKVLGIYKQQPPKYEWYERNFHERVEAQEELIHKKKLEQIKELHKPIDHKELG